MKLFIIVLMLSVALAGPIDKFLKDWNYFKNQFKKSYSSITTEAKRRAAFMKNKAEVDAINRQAGPYKAKLYPFHDLDDDEFYEQYGMLEPDTRVYAEVEEFKVPETRQTLPSSYDARSYWKFNPVRDQKKCPACWAFAAANAMETGVWKKTNTLYDFSEQEMVDCGRGGCYTFSFASAINYLNTAKGIAMESSYPYTGTYTGCKAGIPRYFGSPTLLKISNDATSIKWAIMKYGSLGVSVFVDSGWAKYSGGVYYNTSITSFTTTSNHAVNLIGWGYDTAYRMEYWILRNTYGSYWGESGYIRCATSPAGQMKPDKVYAAIIP